MANNRVMVVGERETFLIRVILKKLQDAGADSFFAPWTVNGINTHWEGTCMIILHMDDGQRPREDVLQFLMDRMKDADMKMIMIGERNDLSYVTDHFPHDLIYSSLTRPVDHEELIRSVTDLLNKILAGEMRKSVLIVDDDPNYLSLVREWLKESYKVAMANSGLQAIKYLGKNKVDLILLDHEMPVTTGPQVLEMLRSDPDTSSIPVMFLTGKSDKESVMAVVALKPEGYFLKTIERKELLEKLDQYFATHK